jgi:outer membrane protein OmpA-like peptidoglycan-associated protein
VLSLASIALCQQVPHSGSVPIYNVQVVERTTKAVNYAYHGGPTKIDFRGTVLLPQAKGEATVESLRGRTEIDAKFDGLVPTTRFGREYLTYTLWAITPEGAPHNIGEIVPDGSNKARLHVTTELQAFGLIITAEPYSTTRQPSDVVVVENQTRPDTVGKVESIDVKYELMPRGRYTWEVPNKVSAYVNEGPKVSMHEYEATLEMYEAQNAVGIARAAGADQYAPETIAKAQTLLDQARQLYGTKAPSNVVVETARESVQTAEDARSLTERRKTDQRLSSADRQVSEAQRAQAQAQEEASRARMDADAARSQVQADRLARERAEADAAQARAQLAQKTAEPQPVHQVVTETTHVVVSGPSPDELRQADNRTRLFQELNRSTSALDTPRGVVVTLQDVDFYRTELSAPAVGQVARLVNVLRAYPDLHVEVEGYCDSGGNTVQAEQRAESVRMALVNRGLTAERVSARGMGDTRPLTSNGSPVGRIENRRIEIVITGNSIGDRPVWDRTYTVNPRQ